ncbi:MAG: nucleoside triphosphate pyrophosphohydrolase [Candidatus Latescibacteria bacterium]|nr:nucleoside triphosphate pyrophosphohydrolase [Candidatus Latescibacterota bacterium]
MPDTRIAACFEELIRVMARLREEGGCPWDREQTHESLKPYLIEEAYEAIEAMDEGDEAFKEELGDVLLQVVFHARIAEERGGFDIGDVLATHVAKLKRRHPHVFGDVKVQGTEDVWANWERIKREENTNRTSALSGIPKALPALLKARRVQEKASLVGFDWEQADEVLEKVEEELAELKAACASHEQDAIREEFGDLLFSLVNYARFLNVDPEDALQRTVAKFSGRFQAIEEALARRGRTPSEASFEEMDAIWEEGKKKRQNEKGEMQSEK